MARPKADLPEAEAIRALADGEGRLAVRITPCARSEAALLEEVLAQVLGSAPSRRHLLRGATLRDELVQLD